LDIGSFSSDGALIEAKLASVGRVNLLCEGKDNLCLS